MPAHVHPLSTTSLPAWRPSDADLLTIGPAGRVFLEEMLGGYDFSLLESRLLLEAGHAVAALAAVRAVNRTGFVVRDLGTLERMEIAWQKQLAALLAQLKVTHEAS